MAIVKYSILLGVSLGLFSFVHAQTIIPSGEVYGTWTQNNAPYHITGTINIPHDSTLIIEPGVKVEFQGNYELKVLGRLLAEGTKADTILFTVNDTTGYFTEDTTLGGWKGISIFHIDESNDSTKLAYCRLEFGKAIGPAWPQNSGGALYVFRFDKVSVSHCLFVNNKACTYDDMVSWGGAVCFEHSDIHFSENTFSNNKAFRGGAIYCHDSDPVFQNNLFIHNQCGLEGGGLSAGGGSNPSFSRDVFQYNRSENMGGGLMLYGPSNINIDGVIVKGNIASWAGGLGFVGCEVKIKDATISHNLATAIGGGIACDASTVIIENSIFEKDSSSNIAGGIHVWQGSIILKNVSLVGNSAYAGGGLNGDWSKVVLEQSQIKNNSAQGGGGLFLFNSHLLMDNCSLEGNSALTNAGAIEYAVDSLVFDSLFVCSLLGSEITKNRSGNAAGGMSIQQTHTNYPLLDLRIDSCLIADNSAHHVGGFRIMRCMEPLELSNSIVKGNQVEAWTGGGSISNQSKGHVYNCLFYDNHSALVDTGATTGGLGIASMNTKVDVNHCTFFGNSAGRGGGLQVYRGGDAVVSNSIFWENYPHQLALSAVWDTIPCTLTLNHNNIQYGLDSIKITDSISTVIFGTGNLEEDPLFVNPSHSDFHLMDTSPAIGAAKDSIQVEAVWYYSPPFDIEGNPRPDPHGSQPDLGVFENMKAWPVGIKEHLKISSEGFDIHTYPNPFKHRITFEINIPEKSDVTLEIFNLLGEHIQSIRSQNHKPGIHSVLWTPTQLENHFYIYRIRVEYVSNRVFIKTGQILRID